jgi:hypothetical protein
VQAIIEEQEKKESKLRPNIFHKPEILKQKKDIFGLLMERTSSVEEVDLAYLLNKLAFSKDHGAHSTTTENPGRGLGLPSGVSIVAPGVLCAAPQASADGLKTAVFCWSCDRR